MAPKALLLTALLAALAPLGGCIVGDQLSTLTILPDGSAEWVKLHSNIRSTEPGARGQEELKRYIEEFDARKDSDSLQITQAGGRILESRWLRREEPCSNLQVARLPDEASLLAFLTVKDEKGEATVQPRLSRNGSRRRLSITATLPRSEEASIPDPRQEAANGLSETRIVPAGGRIVESRGFAVAEDRRSALIGHEEVRRLLQSKAEKVEIYLEWEPARE